MKIPALFAILSVAVITCSPGPSLQAQESRSVDLLTLIDLEKHVLLGNWESTSAGLKVSTEEGRAVCRIPLEVSSSYELAYEFTRESGNDTVGVILPLGRTQVYLELSGWDGTAHGLSRIQEQSTKSEDNPTSVRPGKLVNGKRYRVRVRVRTGTEEVAIAVLLDGKTLIDWSGPYDEVEPNVVYRLGRNDRLALAANKCTTVFHAVKLTPGEPPREVVRPIPPGKVDLTAIDWREKKGSIEVVEFQGQKVVRTQGQDDTVALLPGVELEDGTIEVEIASDIFSGIALRGKDTSNYDLLYFRPQNSGTAKHDKTVQYVSKGQPGADWRTLREKFPGKYEAGADLKVDEWFRVRLELKGDQLEVFVNDLKKPALTVAPLLGKRPTGKIGLWGWRSHFRNFSYRPARKPEAKDRSDRDRKVGEL